MMKNDYPLFSGQMPILPTTVGDDGTIDIKSQKKLADYCLDNRAAAIGHLGAASEYHKLSQKERETVISTLVERVDGRVPVFVGTTCLSLRQSIENAKTAQKLGADLLMVCSPIYGAVDQEQLFRYYSEVSQEVALPIIVQDTGASSSQYTAEFIARLAREIPTVGYAKAEGQGFLAKTCELLETVGGRIQIIGGAGGFHMIQLLRQGITAFMTGTEACEIHGAVIRAYLSGDIDGAVGLYYSKLLPYLEIFNMNPNAMLKYMLQKRGLAASRALLFPDDTAPLQEIVMREFDWIWERIQNGGVI